MGRGTGARPAPPVPVARYAGPPFSHRIHRELGCTSCHTSERAHGELTVRAARDCQLCHHSAERSIACEGCHDRQQLARAIPSEAVMRLSVAESPRRRTLAFRHPQHRELECAACHTAAPSLAVTRGCTSCHAQHHGGERSCLACHAAGRTASAPRAGGAAGGGAGAGTGGDSVSVVQAAHGRASHQGCSGRGCHAGETVATFAATRNVCLSCHQTLVDHRRGRECADCHRVRWAPAAAARSN